MTKWLNSKVMKWIYAGLMGLVVLMAARVVIQQWDVLIAFPWKFNLGFLLLASFSHSLGLFVTFVIWSLMMARMAGFRDFGQNFRIYYLSSLAKRIPTALPYVGGRMAMYVAQGVPGMVVLNGIVFENLLVGLGGMIAFFAFLPFYSGIPSGVTLGIGLAGAVLIILLVIRPQIFIDATNFLLRKLKRREIDLVPQRRDLLSWTGLYILPWLTNGFSFYFLMRAIIGSGIPGVLNTLEVATISALVGLLSMVLPGGFGLKEFTAGALFTQWMPFSTALVVTLAFRLMQTVDEIIWALVALAWANYNKGK